MRSPDWAMNTAKLQRFVMRRRWTGQQLRATQVNGCTRIAPSLVALRESDRAGARLASCSRMLRLALTVMMLAGAATARADAVVTDGRFTNVYVYVPDTPGQTWDQHMQQWRPSDWQSFTRASIDHFTDVLMAPSWPSYFGALHQYAGINPPQFFGSYVASANCVAAAIKDLHGGTYQHGGILEETTIRSLANCHASGMDPSPQVNLIFSPQIHVGDPTALPSGNADGPDMCVHGKTAAYHAFGLNTPNFAGKAADQIRRAPAGSRTSRPTSATRMSR